MLHMDMNYSLGDLVAKLGGELTLLGRDWCVNYPMDDILMCG